MKAEVYSFISRAAASQIDHILYITSDVTKVDSRFNNANIIHQTDNEETKRDKIYSFMMNRLPYLICDSSLIGKISSNPDVVTVVLDSLSEILVMPINIAFHAMHLFVTTDEFDELQSKCANPFIQKALQFTSNRVSNDACVNNFTPIDYSELIQKEFSNLLDKIEEKPKTNSDDRLSRRSSANSDELRKWYPGKKWTETEISKLIKIVSIQGIPELPVFHIRQRRESVADSRNRPHEPGSGLDKIFDNNSFGFSMFSDRLILRPERNEQLLIQLQIFITELDDEHFDETVDFLDRSVFLSSLPRLHCLLHEFVNVASIRPEKIPLIVKLFKSLNELINAEAFDDDEIEIIDRDSISFERILIEFLLHPCSVDEKFLDCAPRLYLLKQCLKGGVASGEEIAQIYAKFYRCFPNSVNFHNFSFVYFAKEIEKYQKEIADIVVTKIDNSCWYSYSILGGTLTEFYDLRKKGWKGMDELTTLGMPQNSLEYCIKKDMVEKLQDFDCSKSIHIIFSPYKWNAVPTTPIQWAALCGSVKCFCHFLEQGESTVGLMKFAIAGGSNEIIGMCNRSATKEEMVYASAEYRYYRIFDPLSKDFNEADSNEVLCFCSRINWFRGVVFGSTCGGDIKYRSSRNGLLSPLHEAAIANNTDVVSYLLCIDGIDPNIQDEDGNTPLHLAARYNNFLIICLLASTPDIKFDIENKDCRTVAHEAALNGSIECIRVLSTIGTVDFNVKDKNGLTPIMLANRNQQASVTRFLSDLPNVDTELVPKQFFSMLSLSDKMTSDGSVDDLTRDMSWDAFPTPT